MAVEPYDDDEIGDGDRIARRIIPEQHVVPDQNTGRSRISTKLMRPSSAEQGGGMSVDLLELMQSAGVRPEEFLLDPPFAAAVAFPAEAARALRLMIGKDPIEDSEKPNPYHGEIWARDGDPNKFSRRQSKALLAASDWVIPLEDVDIAV
jgi:hypothetical protein